MVKKRSRLVLANPLNRKRVYGDFQTLLFAPLAQWRPFFFEFRVPL